MSATQVKITFDAARVTQETAQQFWAEGDRFRAVGAGRYEWVATKNTDDPREALGRVREQLLNFVGAAHTVIATSAEPVEED